MADPTKGNEPAATTEAEATPTGTAAVQRGEKTPKTATKQLERVPRPDTDAKDAKIKELSDKIDSLLAERSEVDKQQQLVRAGNKPFHDKKRELVNKAKALRDKRNAFMNSAKDIKERVDAIVKKEQSKREKQKQAREQLRFSNVSDVDAKIAALERKHETTALSREEEKVVMKEIQALKATRRKVAEFVAEQAATSAQADDIPTLRAEIKAKRAEADKFKPEIESISAELDKLAADNKEASAKGDKLQKRRDKLQKEINALFQEREQVKKDFSKQWTAFKKHLTELNKQRDAERKEREAQYRKEREEYERKLEEEELKQKPWEAEIALCDALIKYLGNVSGGSAKAASPELAVDNANGAPKPSGPVGGEAPELRAGSDDFGDLKPVGKKAVEEESFLVMGKAKAKKSKANKKKKPDGRLTHPLDLLQSFAMLELRAPAKVEDVPESIKQLQEKRAYYDVLPRAPRKSKPAASAEPAPDAADAKPKKTKQANKTAPPSVQNAEVFPELPGSRSPKSMPANPPVSGLSAVDMVKSSGPSSPSDAAE